MDSLALMIAKGFEATTNDISQLRTEMKEIKAEVSEIKETTNRITIRLSPIIRNQK